MNQMIVLKSGIDGGRKEYYFVELESYEDFDVIVNCLKSMGLFPTDCLDGIYSRKASFVSGDIRFRVVFHEDVGVYSYLNSEQSNHKNDSLKKILVKIVESLNTK